jgi:hypothetical protein
MLRPFAFMAAFVVGLTSSEPRNVLPTIDHELRRFSEASVAFITKGLTPVKAQTEAVDPKAAANLDEDLDWRIAEQKKSEDGWRAFLDAHPNGKHSSIAKTELAKLEPPPPASPPPPPAPKLSLAVEVANAPHAPDYFAALERPPPPETRIVETTVVKWRERGPRTRYVVRYARPRHYRSRPPPPPNIFMALFGPRPPRTWQRGW